MLVSGVEKDLFARIILASHTCSGPGCLDSWLSWLLLMEKPTQLVLHFLFALFLTLLLFDTLFPFEFFLLVGFSWPLMLIFLLHVLQPLLVPFLSSSVNKMPDYSREATPKLTLLCGLFAQRAPSSQWDAKHQGILFFRWRDRNQ